MTDSALHELVRPFAMTLGDDSGHYLFSREALHAFVRSINPDLAALILLHDRIPDSVLKVPHG